MSRILLVTFGGGLGGVETAASRLVAAWRRAGHQVQVLLLEDEFPDDWVVPLGPGAAEEQLERLELPRGWAGRPWTILVQALRVRARIRRSRPDVVVSLKHVPMLLTPLAAWGTGRRLIGCEHRLPPDRPPGRYEKLRRWSWARHDLVVTPVAGTEDALRQDGARTAAYVPNPIDASFFGVPQRRERHVVFCGRLSEEKGLLDLFQAWALVHPRHPEWTLLVAGSGPMQAALSELQVELGLTRSVTMLGAVSDVPALLASARVFVLPSRYEVAPVALVEAMAARTACVATPSSPMVELLCRQGAVQPAPAHSPSGLADAICIVLSDAGLEQRLAEAGQTAAEEARSDRVAARWLELGHVA